MNKKNRYWLAFTIPTACVVLAALFVPVRAAEPAPKQRPIDFNRDIRPILSDNCYACHGPDKNKRKADLRIDTKDGFFTPIKDHTPVVPGHSDQSELFHRITTDDKDERMPDPKSNKRLSPKEVALIKRWIDEGAQWKGHWAYLKPESQLPADNADKWAINPIDRFISQDLSQRSLQHSPPADHVTLIRRLYFDLVGLPPTPQQVQAFIADQSPNAYDKVVNELLASPHFGERMAIYWLDLVRYADTIGYHSDNPRDIFPYRDWVISAFNNNQHFDQFTIEQLAGDLLPNSTLQQKVASAYNRLLQTTEEGGAQPKEYTAKYASDRVRNVSTVWLGSTMGCCECHDHKFDPFLTRDFYSMEAFFADIKEAAVGRREAGMPVANDEQLAKLKAVEERVATAQHKLDANTPELAAGQAKWEQSIQSNKTVQWKTLTPASTKSEKGTTLKVLPDGALLATGPAPDTEKYTITVQSDLKAITAFRLEALPDDSLPNKGPGRGNNGNFVLSHFDVQLKDGEKLTPVPLQNATASYEQKEFAITNTIAEKPEPKKGWAMMEKAGTAQYAYFETKTDVGDGLAETTLVFTLRHEWGSAHQLGKFRLSATADKRPIRVEGKGLPKEIQDIAGLEADKRNDAQKKTLATYYRTIAPELNTARAELATVQKERDAFVASVPKCLISTAEAPRVIKILHRGNWQDETGDVVQPAIPAFLGKLEIKDRRANRLDLAQWLVARDNPLTARVFVNRLWKLFYGEGLARRLEDLGSQGEPPTHPELLDWLAVDFMDSGWDIKHTIKQMVTSATYRQASTPTAEQKERDPENRWYAHQSRFRLDAEFVRDNALAVSGLLSLKIGGDSVHPYQPPGYWDFLNFPTRTWAADKGDSEYRRGLYTWWQRTFLHPSLLAFDAPTREECTADRPRSNVPQQALTLLNDPTYVEAARVFATHILQQGGQTTIDKLTFAYQNALSRNPRPQEIQLLTTLLERQTAEYQKDKSAAEKLLTEGQSPAPKDLDAPTLAAWTSIARTILNLHETITRN